jgi:hypothetical protein
MSTFRQNFYNLLDLLTNLMVKQKLMLATKLFGIIIPSCRFIATDAHSGVCLALAVVIASDRTTFIFPVSRAATVN